MHSATFDGEGRCGGSGAGARGLHSLLPAVVALLLAPRFRCEGRVTRGQEPHLSALAQSTCAHHFGEPRFVSTPKLTDVYFDQSASPLENICHVNQSEDMAAEQSTRVAVSVQSVHRGRAGRLPHPHLRASGRHLTGQGPRFHLTGCINEMVLCSQFPYKTVNALLTVAN